MNDLKLIKKYYGEKMAQKCSSLFSDILDTEGLLFEILSRNFYYSKTLWDDIESEKMIEEFKDTIYCCIKSDKGELVDTDKTPFELMDEAGYILYECKTEEDIQSFRKYYDKLGKTYDRYVNGIPQRVGEELCTFNGGRLKECTVFFAVKKNVDEYKRAVSPEREDDYSTSVISIQFRKGMNNTVSIKSRYNHTVERPDATLRNDLERIIPGLTRSFEKYYNLNISKETESYIELHNYMMDKNGKMFKFNYEINNVYYCPNNMIIDNFSYVNVEPESILILDYFIFDLKNKTIRFYDENIVDSFPAAFEKIDKMEVHKINDSTKKELLIYHDGVISKIIFEDGVICELEYNGNMKVIDCFMDYSKYMYSIKLSNAEVIEKGFLPSNFFARISIDLPNVKTIKSNCVCENDWIKSFKAPKVTNIGSNFLDETDIKFLEELDLSSLINIEDENFLKKISEFDGILKISDKYKEIINGSKVL